MTALRRDRGLRAGSEWSFDDLSRAYEAIEEVALGKMGLEIYPNQIEVISSEQMLDAYCSIGMPLMYRHWSFGKRFVREERQYRAGQRGLAYEIVINSDPCISYLLEDNTMAMQTLVMAHAAFGHNHFFRNNYLFQQWTDAEGILDYLDFARGYVQRCEERHGVSEVEAVLDAAHALMEHGVFRYRRPRVDRKRRLTQERERLDHVDRTYNDLWRTVPKREADAADGEGARDAQRRRDELRLPEENLLYFLEKRSPILEEWQRELVRIVRNVAQYFYPQRQTRLMNEGCATFVHYEIVNELHRNGTIGEGALLEMLHSHTNAVTQASFDEPHFSGLNPYALGLAMMQDIVRVATQPTAEDRAWNPTLAGRGDGLSALKDAWANYRDESFIRQFLSPHLIRKLRLFQLRNDAEDDFVTVAAIHDERGYDRVREGLARMYDLACVDPEIQIVDVDFRGDRQLRLQHTVDDGVLLEPQGRDRMLGLIRSLWGYQVSLVGVDRKSGATLYEAASE